MDITQLITLVHVAELGSLSKAADRLNIVQPALSRQVRMLEEELGVALFERHGRGMAVTPIGEEVLEHAVRVLAEMDAIRHAATKGRASYKGLMRIGTTPTVGDIITLPLMQRVREEHPDLNLRFSAAFTGHLLDWLQRGELDIVVSYDPPRSRALKVEPVLVEELYLVTAPDPEIRLDRPVRFAELAGRDFVLPSPRHGLRTIFDTCAAKASLTVNTVVEAETMHTMLDLTRAGYGATIMPLPPLHGYLKEGSISVAPLIDPTPERRVVVCYAADRAISPAARYLGRSFQTLAAELVRGGKWGGRLITSEKP